MISEGPLTMLSEAAADGRGAGAGGELEDELDSILAGELERELSIYRSGSAPPTMEGAMSALPPEVTAAAANGNGLLPEDLLRADPAYLSFYYSHANVNPRLPPPALSKEDWRSTQRLTGRKTGHGGDSAGAVIGRSAFAQPPGFGIQGERELDERADVGLGEWVEGAGATGGGGLMGISLDRQMNFPDIFQENHGRNTPISEHPSITIGHNSFIDGHGQDLLGPADAHFDARPTSNMQNIPGIHRSNSFAGHSFTSVLGSSVAGSSKPDPEFVARVPSPGLPPVGVRMGTSEKKSNHSSSSSYLNNQSLNAVEQANLLAAFSGMNLSKSAIDGSPSPHLKFQSKISDHQRLVDSLPDHKSQVSEQARSYQKSPSASANASPGGSPAQLQRHDALNSAFMSYGLGGYAVNPGVLNSLGSPNMPPLFESAAAAAATLGSDARGINSSALLPSSLSISDLNSPGRMGNQATPLSDPLYLQYLKELQYGTSATATVRDEKRLSGASYAELTGVQKAYIEALAQVQQQYGLPLLGKSVLANQGYYGGDLAYGLGMGYPGSPLGSHINSPIAPGSPLRLGETALGYASGTRSLSGAANWVPDLRGYMSGAFPSLLDEFKSNKTRCFELAEIAGHVVEFSADQYGSRFIQQKLETASVEEKDMVFEEIMPHALTLMTDVFGNYVVQKFFEHGSALQRRELADQLFGHVLALSLQMYGCRVIQKAIEVVDMDQKKKMVVELDGHVMRCVRDQNGNHVIQKCIECVPEDSIQFIVTTFYGQVVVLSTHPYGCRVIQRVLEHCNDPKTQQIVMDEILQSVCMLAQDQYGNYVVQHVLEHGKPHERSIIIEKLTGRIVQMSQQKFASNVVEKCLTFGSLEERQHLINEMLGTTDENEPLQAMMKDQFGNYVVQKVLETCDDQQRELILARIKVHLNALKKYTYGKHIVARVEKLVAAGERRIGLQAQNHPS